MKVVGVGLLLLFNDSILLVEYLKRDAFWLSQNMLNGNETFIISD